MTDILITSIKEAILPELPQIIEAAIKKQREQELAERFLSIDDVQKMFGVSRGTVNNWFNSDILISYQIGGRRLFRYSEVLAAATKIKKYSPNNDVK